VRLLQLLLVVQAAGMRAPLLEERCIAICDTSKIAKSQHRTCQTSN
jgi:hypothetical protein